MLSFLRRVKSYNVRDWFFPLSRILTLEKDVLVIPSILILYRGCHVFFSQQKTRWVFSYSPLPGVRNLLMEVEMPTSNTQCCCVLLALTRLVTHSAGRKMGLEGQRAQSSSCRLWAVFQGLNFCFCFPEQKAWVGFQLP